jgi:hypothetical protein
MMAAGAGYAVARRNRKSNSKKTKTSTTLFLALALILGMTQCKKSAVAPTPTSNQVQITLNANFGGGRTTFNPDGNEGNGTFEWSTSAVEYINVGGNYSGYIGQLSNGGGGSSTFTGSFEIPAGNTTLYFFYLGNGNHAGAETVDFSNQNGTDVTNCHIAVGSTSYSGEPSLGDITLDAKIAIAKFDLSQFGSETVYLSGADVYSTAAIDYTNGTITGSKKGLIKVGTANSEMYVALIPSVSGETTLNFNSNSKEGSIVFSRGIQAPYFYTATGHGALTVTASEGGSIPYTFSVSADKKVIFSPGNLQYQASTGTWRFAENQYDAIGNNAGNNNFTDTRSTQSDWIDLFGWGTSGWDGASAYATKHYQPWDYIGNTPSNTYGYGYGPNKKESYSSYYYTYSLIGEYANCDWGVYNTIDSSTGWRTLTGGSEDAEWNYLLTSRSASTVGETANARYFGAIVNDIKGLVLLPDIYSHPEEVSIPTSINDRVTWNSVSTYTLADWGKMESAGAIFLPCIGYRSYSSNNPSYTADKGLYWSTIYASNSNAYALDVSGTVSVSSVERRRGCSVRLVKDVVE